MNTKKVLIVTSEFPPQPGGIGNHAYNLALYLSKHNITVKVIADQRSRRGKEEQMFDSDLPFKVVRIKRYQQRFIMYLKRIVATYKNINNASTVLATGKFSLWNVAFISLFKKRNTLAIIHGSEVNFKPFLLKNSINIALKQFDTIVAVSDYTKQLVAYLNKPIVVIPNGIQFDKWKLKETTAIELKGQPIIITVGRVSSRKGQLNVIKLLPKLIKQYPKLHYHCIGIPTESEAFKLVAKQLLVENHVTFHGSVESKVLKQMLVQTDVFVMLSTEDKLGDVEGFGIAILEANAMGIPAIGSKGCGIEDAIKPGLSGELVELHSVEHFKDALNTILLNKKAYKKEAEKWAKNHDWSNIIKPYLVLIK